MREIKAVICDIDGTIRKKGEKDLTPATKDVLQRLHDHGVMLGIASGRSIERELLYCAETWGFDFQFDILIGENGAEYYDNFTGKMEVLHILKKEWIKEIIESLQPFDLNPAMYSHKEKILLWADTTTNAINHNIPVYRLVNDVSDFWKEDNKKVMYKVPLDKFDAAYQYILDHPSPYYKGLLTDVGTIEFVEKHVDKASPIKKFCEAHGFDIQEFAAFGDTTNDNEMIAECGFGVCMINGTADTKALADEITALPNEEDGFAEYVKKHILEPRGW
ncbi:MAG: HAD family phosphatase [Erysipelotrichaceae bacterium]|nr:HAD family phosphatase [Erysipelotrichaceae bacterium]MBQ4344260.1 HAD family phosphatase [Erysipelotrichaceae bacterium]